MFTRQFRKLLFLLIFIVWTWKSLSHVRLFATPRTVQSMEFSRPRILEWVAFPFSMGSSQPRDWTQVSCIAGGFFVSWATREAHGAYEISLKVYLLIGVIGSCFTYLYNNKVTEAMRILIEGKKIIKPGVM